MRKDELREACRKEYGDDFVKEYDAICEGIPVGDYHYTVDFLDKVEIVRSRLQKKGFFSLFRRKR